MHIKAFSDGLGTGAGVALPTFGLIFGSLGLTIGTSLTALVLSSITIVLFFAFAIPISYFSYKNWHNEYDELVARLPQAQENIVNHASQYLLQLLRDCLIKEKFRNDVEAALKTKLHKACQKDHLPPQIKAIFRDICENKNISLLKKLASTPPHFDNHNLKINNELNEEIRTTIYNHCQKNNNFTAKPMETSHTVKTTFLSFAAGFASVVGFSSGTLGLLHSIGIFAGLATIPVLGWGLLGLGILAGITIATICVYNATKKDHLHQTVVHHENINQSLKQIVDEKNIKFAASLKAHKKVGINIEQEALDNFKWKKSQQRTDIQQQQKQSYPMWRQNSRLRQKETHYLAFPQEKSYSFGTGRSH